MKTEQSQFLSARKNHLIAELFRPKRKGDWVEWQAKKLQSEGKGRDAGELQTEYDRRKKDGTLNVCD